LQFQRLSPKGLREHWQWQEERALFQQYVGVSFLRIPFDDGYVDSLNDKTLPMHLEMFEGDKIRHHCHFGLKGFWNQNKFQQDV
jgi:hypothetical protein